MILLDKSINNLINNSKDSYLEMIAKKRDKDYIKKGIRINPTYIVICDFIDLYTDCKEINKFEFHNNLFNRSFYRIPSQFDKIGAFKVNTMNASDCGDNFVVGLLYGVLDKNLDKLASDQTELRTVLRFASAAASITSTEKKRGGILPLFSSVRKVMYFLKKQNG